MFEKRGTCKMGRLFSRKAALRLVLATLILLVLGAAGALLSVNGISERNDAFADSSTDTVNAQKMKVDASDENAKQLYSKKAEDVNDTAAVASLLETMKLEDAGGKYSATIKADGDTQVMTIALQSSVQKAQKKTIDKNMENCAEQIMALMPSVGRVEWTYSLISAKAEDETVTMSLDEDAASKQLSKDIRKYGKSERAFKKLLTKQAAADKK